jgi:DnaK suppressor protein
MDELTQSQRDELWSDLERLAEELKDLESSTREGAQPVDLDQPIGRLSRMDAMQQQAMSAANRRRNRTRYQLVKAALKMDPDDYGICKTCDEDIGFARLKVRPESPFCVGCQNKKERGF